MSVRTRVRLYDGVVESQAEERFQADAAEAARQGWHPAERRWNGLALRVVYIQDQGLPSVHTGRAIPARLATCVALALAGIAIALALAATSLGRLVP